MRILLGTLLLLLAACGQAEETETNSSPDQTEEAETNNSQSQEETEPDNGTDIDEADEPGNIAEETNNTPENSGDENAEEEAMPEAINYQAEASLDNDVLHVTMTITNDSDVSQELTFTSAQKYNVRIFDSSGTKKYDFAEDMMFTQAIETDTIEAGESINYDMDWRIEGEPPFEIETELTVSEINGEPAASQDYRETLTVE
ncbi:BsuPI-related putative proteinase inhibitor [Alkalicoccus halolimnae]|uniref:Intracellular proteinase inhibitor BsuPI domain-containing protein n=1 Tax=Alkalicoccus halolimnae TaxID=1667239 RepID=A0AAJ8LUR1_9BACI|nr:BsuPI-related putative proteinase inhibitor [Alkalicoccus halolimnae]